MIGRCAIAITTVCLVVTLGASQEFDLSASGSKERGRQYAELTWTGSSSLLLDLYENGVLLGTIDNDGYELLALGRRERYFQFWLCEPPPYVDNTMTCSSVATVNFP